MDHVRRQFGTFGFPVQTAQQVLGGMILFGVANELELIAAIADLDVQALLDQAQVLVELPAQVGETMGLERLEGETMRFYGCVQGRLMAVRRQLRCIEEYP